MLVVGGAAALMLLAQAPETSSSFADIARVLQSPRCMNCHPTGDGPLQTHAAKPHNQNVKRALLSLGASCSSCHQTRNLAGDHMPPGAPHWTMPSAQMPMVFQGKSLAALCRDVKDPEKNGHRSLDDLLHHVRDDELVKWGWSPGPGRTLPPLPHVDFVKKVADWIAQGAPCPPETAEVSK
jgi:hypothetical protein